MEDLHFCIERPLPHEEHHIQALESVSTSSEHREKLQAAFYTTKLWPPNTKEIKIQFVDTGKYTVAGKNYGSNPEKPRWTPTNRLQQSLKPVDPLQLKLFGMDAKEAIVTTYRERIQPLVPFNLRFVNEGGDVKITLVGGVGSWSLVGTDCLESREYEATLNYGWLDVPTIIHEFCHVLGMIHEHQNPRGNKIQWNEQEVYRWARETQGWDRQTTYNNIIMKYSTNQINGSQYDPESIMLYFFPAILTLDNISVKQNTQMSKTDAVWISKMYPGGSVGINSFMKKLVSGDSLSTSVMSRIFSNKVLIVLFLLIIILIIVLAYYKKFRIFNMFK